MGARVELLGADGNQPLKVTARAPGSDRDVRRAGLAVLALPNSRIARAHLERALGRAA